VKKLVYLTLKILNEDMVALSPSDFSFGT